MVEERPSHLDHLPKELCGGEYNPKAYSLNPKPYTLKGGGGGEWLL